MTQDPQVDASRKDKVGKENSQLTLSLSGTKEEIS